MDARRTNDKKKLLGGAKVLARRFFDALFAHCAPRTLKLCDEPEGFLIHAAFCVLIVTKKSSPHVTKSVITGTSRALFARARRRAHRESECCFNNRPAEDQRAYAESRELYADDDERRGTPPYTLPSVLCMLCN
jgi:hypothetical protein